MYIYLNIRSISTFFELADENWSTHNVFGLVDYTLWGGRKGEITKKTIDLEADASSQQTSWMPQLGHNALQIGSFSKKCLKLEQYITSMFNCPV